MRAPPPSFIVAGGTYAAQNAAGGDGTNATAAHAPRAMSANAVNTFGIRSSCAKARMRSRLHEMCDFLDLEGADYRELPPNGDVTDLVTMWKMRGKTAQVTVRFVSQLVSVTRDAESNATDVNPDKVTDVTDVWTFSRDITSRDPNWKLVATEAGQ